MSAFLNLRLDSFASDWQQMAPTVREVFFMHKRLRSTRFICADNEWFAIGLYDDATYTLVDLGECSSVITAMAVYHGLTE